MIVKYTYDNFEKDVKNYLQEVIMDINKKILYLMLPSLDL